MKDTTVALTAATELPTLLRPQNMRSMLAAIATLVLTLNGCASLERAPEMSAPEVVAEGAWQALNVIDAGQTEHIAHSQRTPAQRQAVTGTASAADTKYCYKEVNPVTSRMIGQHPSSGAVGVTMLAFGIAHLAVTRWLDARVEGADAKNVWAWRAALVAWHAAGVVGKASTVINNQSIGITPFRRGCGSSRE